MGQHFSAHFDLNGTKFDTRDEYASVHKICIQSFSFDRVRPVMLETQYEAKSMNNRYPIATSAALRIVL